MNPRTTNVLVLDDDPNSARATVRALRALGWARVAFRWVVGIEDLQFDDLTQWADVVVTDHDMGPVSSPVIVELCRGRRASAVVYTATPDAARAALGDLADRTIAIVQKGDLERLTGVLLAT